MRRLRKWAWPLRFLGGPLNGAQGWYVVPSAQATPPLLLHVPAPRTGGKPSNYVRRGLVEEAVVYDHHYIEPPTSAYDAEVSAPAFGGGLGGGTL